MPPLPPARSRDTAGYAVLFVCLGNICRSPTAAVVLAQQLAQRLADEPGLAGVTVASAGTGDWHVGEQMDRRTAATLAAAGYDPSSHRAQQTSPELLREYDAILVMDGQNLSDVLDQVGDADRDRVLRYRSFDPAAGTDLDVPDPWYGGQRGFDEVLAIVERTTTQLVTALESVLHRS